MYAEDTYWGSGEYAFVDMSKLQPSEIIGNTHEFGPAPYPYSFDDFAEADKYWIPMGGTGAQKCVRLGATPELARIEARLTYAVEEAEGNVSSANRSLEYARKQLTEHINAHGSTPQQKGN